MAQAESAFRSIASIWLIVRFRTWARDAWYPMKNMAAAARSSSLAPSSSAHGSERIGMGAVETGSGAGAGGGAAGGGGGGGAGGGTGAQAASRTTDSEMRANFEIMASLPLAQLPAASCVSPRGARKPTDHPADRGAAAGIPTGQPANRGPGQGARGSTA